MNYVIETWFHQIPGVRYKMIRTELMAVAETGAVIEIQDTNFEPKYFPDRAKAETARAIAVASTDGPVCGIYDFINLSNRKVAEHFAAELAGEGGDVLRAFMALPKLDRAFFRIRYVEAVVCPARTVAKAAIAA